MFAARLLSFLLFVATALAGTNQEGLDFLSKKGTEEGVVKLPSGLLYKEITKGSGKTPTVDSPTKCHYSGTLIDGTEFDSSYKRGEPLTFAPNQVIKGWTEAMQLMQEGSKWELYIPSELGYGDRGAGGMIPGGAVLVFTMEMIEVLGDSA
uniref:peptidylprolyl isomerase n=1 Tax=Grammatophora oceanica TaxID=210454 RepID=A0A7S1VTK7_9STRA|mmetsp:Transcript_6925/g.10090  ORF Transcript_6925/g.10090 Transcript_6925/m.10090 type:complete len:151 (+) Transcript_6925:87-539(+)|eukprot:CAMPEP_0194049682 /NCGR_PEP_ID=MMETSP0009_2-20130614/30828_1 /TAXON_ID=210454 /ORGANISM="Grammatophora oceanica, Strain CCMP 410" /LENGTH=150 /DNA_ID=CAMNT_0038695891 /DNA_START=87 /DNA_END=539 /DNA_ORIENTATION=-